MLSSPSSITSHFQYQPFKKRRLALLAHTHWFIQGAFSLTEHGRTTIAGYEWQQQDQHYTLNIHSNLNLYHAKIIGRPGKVTLRQSRSNIIQADNPEALMQKVFGWSLPIAPLQDWVRGLPTGSNYHATYDRYGHLMTLVEKGWRVKFLKYTNMPWGADLPNMLIITRPQLALRISIKARE
jgi:outer membrane lipoprotein LolB